MTASPSGSIVALTVHARHVAAPERQAFASRIQALPQPAVVIETCHRVEAYFMTGSDPAGLAGLLELPDGGATFVDAAAIRHAMAVAVGRDSVVVGEDQVLHQVRQAADAARRADRPDRELERLFGRALQAGRRARSWQQGPSRSLADVAIAAIEGRVGSLNGRDLLVVGAGRMGQLAARAGVAAGARVSIANRTPQAGAALAALTGSATLPFDPGSGLATFGGIVVALAGPWSLASDAVEGLGKGGPVVVDLSVPAAVPDAAVAILGGRLITADALASGEGQASSTDTAWLARLDALIDQAAEDYGAWLGAHAGRAAAEALIERADREREAELDLLWRKMPDLEPEARAAIDGMTRHLARRLLREPLERLGRDADGRDEQAVRDLFAL
jgi:glutamyl-tRNA reductase